MNITMKQVLEKSCGLNVPNNVLAAYLDELEHRHTSDHTKDMKCLEFHTENLQLDAQ